MAGPFDSKISMWDEALAMLEEAELHHRRFFALFSEYSVHSPREARPAWEPPADVFDAPGSVLIVVALPGVAEETLSVRVDNSGLVVRGERPLPREIVRIRRLEIPYGVFERRIGLPPGHYRLREQRLTDGCLEISLVRE